MAGVSQTAPAELSFTLLPVISNTTVGSLFQRQHTTKGITQTPLSFSDRVLEKAMHKSVLKPLKAVVSAALQEFQVRGGAWRELKENMTMAKARQPQEMGVSDALPPDPVAIEKIRQKFQTMCKLYSPEKKVTMLLRVCKLIYTIMEDNSGRRHAASGAASAAWSRLTRRLTLRSSVRRRRLPAHAHVRAGPVRHAAAGQ